MIAYNFRLNFIPELNSIYREAEENCANTITIKECHESSLTVLNHSLSFSSNQGRDLTLYTHEGLKPTHKDKLWAFEVKDIATFYWHSGQSTIIYTPQNAFTSELCNYWILHIVLPIFFTIEEQYIFIHAGAVEIEGLPVLFTAESFGGKSTLTDYFIKQGNTMISDDKVAIHQKNGSCYAVSSHPHHRPYRKMEDLGILVKNFSVNPKKVHAIYQLEKRKAAAQIEISEINGMDKFVSLRYASEINIPFLATQRFKSLIKIAKQIPLYKISIPWGLERLPEIYESIVKHSCVLANSQS